MGLIDIAKELSKSAHQNQIDKAGQPYYLHPEKVASFVETDEEKAVAYLHDVLEDTETTVEDFRKAGIPKKVIEAVELLTHKKEEPYFDYLKKVKENDLSRVVKLADLKHNMDISRIENPSENDFERLEKYKKAREFLAEK